MSSLCNSKIPSFVRCLFESSLFNAVHGFSTVVWGKSWNSYSLDLNRNIKKTTFGKKLLFNAPVRVCRYRKKFKTIQSLDLQFLFRFSVPDSRSRKNLVVFLDFDKKTPYRLLVSHYTNLHDKEIKQELSPPFRNWPRKYTDFQWKIDRKTLLPSKMSLNQSTTTNTSCPVILSPSAVIAVSSLNTLCAVLSVSGNSLVLVALWRTPSMHTTSNMFVASLALADFIVGSLANPLYVVLTLMENLRDVRAIKNAETFVWLLTVTATTYNLCAVSIDR